MVAMLGGGDVRPCRCVRCPACCGDGPGAFLSSICGHQVAHPCCVPGSLSTFHTGTCGADGHKQCVHAALSVFACVELSFVDNLLLH